MRTLLILALGLTLSSAAFARTTCIISSDGITTCSNPDGSWGR